jgi:RHS repeat-associated protein
VSWDLAERQGSVVGVMSNGGALLGSRSFDAFGNLVSVSGSGAFDRFGYTGLQADGNTGFLHADNRWYDPATQRWLRRDPIEIRSGQANPYEYVGNNATNRIDPSGLDGYNTAQILASQRQWMTLQNMYASGYKFNGSPRVAYTPAQMNQVLQGLEGSLNASNSAASSNGSNATGRGWKTWLFGQPGFSAPFPGAAVAMNQHSPPMLPPPELPVPVEAAGNVIFKPSEGGSQAVMASAGFALGIEAFETPDPRAKVVGIIVLAGTVIVVTATAYVTELDNISNRPPWQLQMAKSITGIQVATTALPLDMSHPDAQAAASFVAAWGQPRPQTFVELIEALQDMKRRGIPGAQYYLGILWNLWTAEQAVNQALGIPVQPPWWTP